ncbi:hypothetical protein IT774_05085 [Salinimonas marina]|uniref:Uncharacterized protein n=1 Tax=Salinimonas marina TaxID=2785918 RepID=A0A7S9DZ14_9ALTE|nr:hypothetical protein [Salinimonas marina]QPG06548.1 hypothetical protein IT774_05085 [Salinimonas marina]
MMTGQQAKHFLGMISLISVLEKADVDYMLTTVADGSRVIVVGQKADSKSPRMESLPLLKTGSSARATIWLERSQNS